LIPFGEEKLFIILFNSFQKRYLPPREKFFDNVDNVKELLLIHACNPFLSSGMDSLNPMLFFGRIELGR
jgi:hypothetical protein